MLYDSLNDKVLWYFLLNQTTTIRGLRGFTFPKSASALAPVVQRLNNSIHRKNWYLVDKCNQNKQRYLLDSDLPGGERYPPFEQPVPGQSLCCTIFSYTGCNYTVYVLKYTGNWAESQILLDIQANVRSHKFCHETIPSRTLVCWESW